MSKLPNFMGDLSFVQGDPAQVPGWQTHSSKEANGNKTHLSHETSSLSARILYRPQQGLKTHELENCLHSFPSNPSLNIHEMQNCCTRNERFYYLP